MYFKVSGRKGTRTSESVIRTPLTKKQVTGRMKRTHYKHIRVHRVKESTAWRLARESKRKYTAKQLVGFRLK